MMNGLAVLGGETRGVIHRHYTFYKRFKELAAHICFITFVPTASPTSICLLVFQEALRLQTAKHILYGNSL